MLCSSKSSGMCTKCMAESAATGKSLREKRLEEMAENAARAANDAMKVK